MPRVSLLNPVNKQIMDDLEDVDTEGVNYADVCGACYGFYRFEGQENHRPYSQYRPLIGCHICDFALGLDPADD